MDRDVTLDGVTKRTLTSCNLRRVITVGNRLSNDYETIAQRLPDDWPRVSRWLLAALFAFADGGLRCSILARFSKTGDGSGSLATKRSQGILQ